MTKYGPIPLTRAGFYLRETAAGRLSSLGLAAVYLVMGVVALAFCLVGILQSIAAFTHDYYTWGLAVYLGIAVLGGAGAITSGQHCLGALADALRPIPATYQEPAEGAAVAKIDHGW